MKILEVVNHKYNLDSNEVCLEIKLKVTGIKVLLISRERFSYSFGTKSVEPVRYFSSTIKNLAFYR